jgi:hypothetical protein
MNVKKERDEKKKTNMKERKINIILYSRREGFGKGN